LPLFIFRLVSCWQTHCARWSSLGVELTDDLLQPRPDRRGLFGDPAQFYCGHAQEERVILELGHTGRLVLFHLCAVLST